jgi:hypothetical protein
MSPAVELRFINGANLALGEPEVRRPGAVHRVLHAARSRNRHDRVRLRSDPRQHDLMHRPIVFAGEVDEHVELRQLLRQPSAADRAVGEEGDPAPYALLRNADRLAKIGIQPVL